MSFVLFIVKFYIVILCLRYVSTNQELMFNPFGKMIALVTDPIFKQFRQAKEQTDRYVFVLIALLIVFSYLLLFLASGNNYFLALVELVYLYSLFFMQLFIVTVLLGCFARQQFASYYLVFFFRIGMPFVKITSKITRIKSMYVTIPTVILIFALYTVIAALPSFLLDLKNVGLVCNLYETYLKVPIVMGLLSLTKLLFYYSIIFFARAMVSWISPDPRSSIVQILYSLTEPLIAPVRKIVPPIAMIDLSIIIVTAALYFISRASIHLITTYLQ